MTVLTLTPEPFLSAAIADRHRRVAEDFARHGSRAGRASRATKGRRLRVPRRRHLRLPRPRRRPLVAV